MSDPVPTGGVAAAREARIAAALTGTAGDEFAYVSLPPGTVPAGRTAIVRRVGDLGSVITTVFGGGFDPVPVDAQAGDSVEVRVTDAGGATLFQARRAVADGRAPVVVRTNPPRGKTDVAVNASMVIVFSEPIAASSLTSSSVQLFRGTARVAGTVSLLQGTGAAIAFTPVTPLDRSTGYRVVVTRAVRDLDGDALAAGVSVAFATGQSSTGPAASVTVSPDTVYLTGATYQMTATVRDAAGNELIDQPITWSTSDPNGLTVSSTGLLTALTVGSYHVDATVNGVLGRAEVSVGAGAPASIAISPTQATVGAAGDTIALTATVRDGLGRLVDHPSMTWTSSDVAAATVAADSSGSSGLAFATVTGVSPGSATITARSGTASKTAAVTVTPPLPIASLTVTPDSVALLAPGTVQLTAVVRDSNGKVLAGRPIAWATDNAAAATVDGNGLVTGIGEGAALVTAASEGLSDTAAVTVHRLVLMFTSARDGNYEIYVTNADGSVVLNLTNNAAADNGGAWSPDGQKIAFYSARDGNGNDIYVMNTDGSALTKLTNNGRATGPTWSPDGQKIAFVWVDGSLGILDIYVMNADGSALVRLTGDAAPDYGPAWSPDGERIAFVSGPAQNGEIYVMNADGSAQTRLTNNATTDGAPAWSPDGQRIAFVSYRGGNNNEEIYVMNADGSAQTRLTNNAATDGSPAWSPDGSKIAFVSGRDGNLEIYVMNPDGSGQTRLTNNADADFYPVWSPDGQKLAFVSGRDGPYGEIYVMNADGTTPIRITNHPASDVRPLWRP